MTAVLVRCRACGREVASADCDRSLACTLCRATAAVSLDVQQYERAWAKRSRYAAVRIPLAHVEDQLRRLAARIAEKLHQRITDAGAATEILNGLLAEARRRAESRSGLLVGSAALRDVLGGR